MARTRIWYVAGTTADGDNLDWFVEAEDREEAVALWRAEDFVAAHVDATYEPKVFPVPEPTGTPRVVAWPDVA